MNGSRKVVFKSNLLGGFGAGFFTAPNFIDFSTVFNNFGQSLLENAPVVFTIIGVIVIYIPLLILCRRLDNKDKFRVEYRNIQVYILCLNLIISYLELNIYIFYYLLHVHVYWELCIMLNDIMISVQINSIRKICMFAYLFFIETVIHYTFVLKVIFKIIIYCSFIYKKASVAYSCFI